MSANLSMVRCFSEVEDPRVDRTKRHLLVDILCLSVMAVIAGAEGWEDIEAFGREKSHWVKQYLRLPNGIPSHDTIARVFRVLKPHAFQAAFIKWVDSLHEHLGLKRIAIDGKTLRRSHDRKTMKSALHAVCAWSVDNHVVLGQESVDQKSNEITAIPELLKILELKNAIVSIDAMGCQKQIAKQIVDNDGDYVLAVKDNHPTLHEAIKDHFTALHEGKVTDVTCRKLTTRDKGHGREEERLYTITDVPESLNDVASEWAGIKSVGEVINVTRQGGKESVEVRHFIGSIQPKVRQFAESVRGHWSIENSLHWVLDVTFREDESRIRKDNGPDNFSLLRRFAITLIKQDKSPGSVRSKRKRAGWNNTLLAKILRLST